MIKLTEKQNDIYNFIIKYFTKNMRMPTIREIGEAFDFGDLGSRDHLKALERKGYLTKDCKKSRGLKFTKFNVKLEEIIEVLI